MKTITLDLYSASELKESFPDGFENALEHWRNDSTEIFWEDETIESLKALVKASGLTLKDWSLGVYGYSYIKIDWDSDDVKDLAGNRALAWLENNLLSDLRIKFTPYARIDKEHYIVYPRAKLAKYGKDYRAGKIEPCPFTGYFADEVYLESIIKAIKEGYTLGEAYSWLADECQKLLEQELENQNSEEYFIDHAEANEYQFTEDGELHY